MAQVRRSRWDRLRLGLARRIAGRAGVVSARAEEIRASEGPAAPDVRPGQLEGLDVVAMVVREELEAQDRRGDAIDTKAGLVLGFAGVLAGVQLHGTGTAHLAAVSLDGLTALIALLALLPRPFPGLAPRRIRGYAPWSADQAKLTVMDTRIEIFETTRRTLNRKAYLLLLGSISLLLAVVVTVGERPRMRRNEAVAQPIVEPKGMPPLTPDPEAIDHLEGNEREIRKYREHAEAERKRATNGNGHADD